MAVTSGRSIVVKNTGDIEYTQQFDAAASSVGSGEIDQVTLSAGNNTITPPANAKAVTISKPSGNTSVITLKGVNGDTGVPLHLTDPDSISLNTAAAFVLNAVTEVIVKLLYT
jgi:hypothetical protein